MKRLCAAMVCVVAAACGGTTSSTADVATNLGDPRLPIKHIIIVVKENHTFDNYFGSFPGAEGNSQCTTARGVITCPHAPDRMTRDLCHTHECALTNWNGGAMDGWENTSTTNHGGDELAFAQYHESDIPNYWAYARAFTLGDHFFANELGPSFAGHMMFLAAQGAWTTNDPNEAVAHPYWGCDQPSDARVDKLDAQGNTVRVFPCFDIPSIPDLLPSDVTWKFYGSHYYFLSETWSMFNAIKHIRYGPAWAQVQHEDKFDYDIDHHSLPSVSWLVDQDFADEHPLIGSVCQGENWTVRHLNKLMQSEYWKDSAVIITMDDFGGWYDHVPPPTQYGGTKEKPYGYGFRLPLIVMSPYAKPHYIFKEFAEQASIPRFIEKVFGIQKRLSDLDPAARDGQANDLTGAFDFNQAPLPPLVLPTRDCI